MEEIDTSFFMDAEEAAAPSQTEQMQNTFSFKQVGSITKYIEPIGGENPIDLILEMFKIEPDLDAIPVETAQGVGVIDRRTALAATNTAWKRLTAKSAAEYVKPVGTVLYARDFIEKTLQKISALSHENGETYFPVFNNRSFFGIVSLDDFLARIAEIREQDLEKAALIQKGLMPSAEKIATLPFSVMAYNRMANALGGDYYQIDSLDDSHYVAACYDVSGKNVAASLVTVALGSFFKPLKLLKDPPGHPLELVSMLDRYLEQIVPMGTFVTAALCFIDRDRKQIILFNCGHTTVYVFFTTPEKKLKIASVEPGLPPLGMGAVATALFESKGTKEKPFTVLPLMERMHISLYSDGFTDMQSDDGLRYGDDRAKKFFIQLYPKPVPEAEAYTEKTITDWIQNSMLPDDVTLLEIRL